MKVLVIGGMHGNEPLGLAVVDLIKANPIASVSVLKANEKAIRAKKRFTKFDLNRSFPGNLNATEYEPRRAAEILEETSRYDIVLDFHNTYCPDNDCSFIGKNSLPLLVAFSQLVGLNRIVVADYDCINKYANNCISIEVSLSSRLNNASYWYEMIKDISKKTLLATDEQAELYKFVYRITLQDKERLGLRSVNLKAFKPISKSLAENMGVKSPAYPIFIADKYTPYNFGGLLNKIN